MNRLLLYIGPALRLLRRKHGLRQYEAAQRAGISKFIVSGYESGRRLPSLRTLARILDALDARLLDLGRFVEHVEGASVAHQGRGGSPPLRPVLPPHAESLKQ